MFIDLTRFQKQLIKANPKLLFFLRNSTIQKFHNKYIIDKIQYVYGRR